MNKYYVYHLVDPRTNQPFYVGKGKDRRAWNHLKHTTTGSAKNKRINEIRQYNMEPKVKLISEGLSEQDAYMLEDKEILKYGRIDIEPNGILTNNRLSAFSPEMTPAVREAISISRQGIKFTTEHKKKLSQAKKGKTWEEIFGVERAAEMRKERSQPRVPLSASTRQKISKANKGRQPHKWSEESRKKASESRKGHSVSEETRNKLKEINNKEMTCPHCGFVGKGLAMRRWHFNNCKSKI